MKSRSRSSPVKESPNALSPASSRAQVATRAPSASRSRTTSAPRPRLPPVTTTLLPRMPGQPAGTYRSPSSGFSSTFTMVGNLYSARHYPPATAQPLHHLVMCVPGAVVFDNSTPKDSEDTR